MPQKFTYAVQFLFPADGPNGRAGLLIEQLRYMRLLSVVRDNDNGYVLRVPAPAFANADIWATRNAERMRSFGLNAEVVKLPTSD